MTSKNKLDPIGTLVDVMHRVEEYEARVVSKDVDHNSLSRDRAYLVSLLCSQAKSTVLDKAIAERLAELADGSNHGTLEELQNELLNWSMDLTSGAQSLSEYDPTGRREYHAMGTYWSGVPTVDMPCDFCTLGIIEHDPRTHACPPEK